MLRDSGVHIQKRKVVRQFCLSEAGTTLLLKDISPMDPRCHNFQSNMIFDKFIKQ